MQRTLILAAMAVGLAIPGLAAADQDETVISREANWTPTLPARPTVDLGQLAEVLVAKEVITHQDYARLTQPQVSSPAGPGHARVWTWEEIDHDPVRRAGASE